ncbi:multicopper oxidase family protein [Micrococcus sp.]|uniref:multicopper oxidase family protein n=1 Tax=Micrococcus sp. TaxID=1271 RepID=UPI002A91FE4E|nr:multicopper oxidase family protein [Micrococcus sp.]MDY6055262.1 multicopper oxidase family protein [Micrococcus sp.]
MHTPSRRHVLLAGLGLASAGALSACGSRATPGSAPGTPAIPSQSPLTAAPGTRTVEHVLTPRPVTLDLGGVTAKTWAYEESLDAPALRATAGDLLQVRVDNRLPTDTSVHWHGLALRQASDGVPGVTQEPIEAGASFTYQFVAPDPGTYFFHPHTGVQIDRGLYGPLIIDDPEDPGHYDQEWVITLDDWTDGVGSSPDDLLAGLQAQSGDLADPSASAGAASESMGQGAGHGHGTGHGHGAGHDMAGMHHGDSPLGDAGDLAYPHYLVNGRVPEAPRTLTGRPGQRVRLRIINAASDTIFRFALQGHRLTVTHTDGFPVNPTEAVAVYLAMGERLDALVTLDDGVFVFQAAPEGKDGTPARAIVRTGAGRVPAVDKRIAELDGKVLLTTELTPAEGARLPEREPDVTLDVDLNGQMQPYAWGLNGTRFGHDTPLEVSAGQRVRLRMRNMTAMAHPMHIHGHTWALPGSGGLRKDTVLLRPMETVEADLQADNPGVWMLHCHNIYHAELGMMTSLRY